MINYSSEQLKKWFDSLPQELQKVILDDETNDSIYKILENNKILDERAGQISDLIRNVLWGLLPPEEFVSALGNEVDLNKDLAKKIYQETSRFVFFPVKSILNDLHKIEKTDKSVQLESTQKEIPEPEKPEKSDSYLEPME